ncbi:YdeI/OmpD-associated family protein [Anianabacter salinae]|uniref:YdeI/OmpD-associated family protein n=1 Tax=Anianabacter salinae TaxID=2851023 RepID=UPI00225E6EBF|nr:DUF1801 domain-containing protein [Anianabacter salinae]MBV0912968.1 DUF1801 domain-containing protein [Anianabacter salinae]
MQDARIEAWFDEDGPWRDELRRLRGVLLSCPLVEVWKWRQPCYVAHGGNICILHGFNDAVGLGFFKGVLLSDPHGVLTPAGPNSRSARVFRVTSLAEIDQAEDALRALVAQAVALEAQGARVDLPKDDIALPRELVEAFDTDVALAGAFAALTPGRQRGYAIHISGGKQPETRRARIYRHRARILQGKGMHDR